ncbi:hypothetical protein ACFYU9_11385 [Streptomyces sp. NPDC004327]|uniref:hypothetical protein n=1 Tax=unclassified Streptomyces TaxID=2593676 RepID=UPI0036BD9D15
MSAQQTTGIRKTATQLALALVACLAVAGGAAAVAHSDDAAVQQQPGVAGAEWPAPPASPTPTN